MKKLNFKIFLGILSSILLIILVFSCFSSNVEATSNTTTLTTSSTDNDCEEVTTIKIGYILNYGTIKSPIISGEEGYGYEYLSKIFEYADGNYELEFIYCEWEESKEMLANGELDIIGPATYTDTGAECYLYPDDSFGDNIVFLSTLSEDGTPYNSYGDIDGSKIAVQKNNPNEYLLLEFLDENDFEAEIIYFTDNDYEAAMISLDCDFCLSSSLQTVSSLSPVATLGIKDFYYVTDINNSELIDIINDAMEELSKQEFFYQEQLYLSYYNYTINSSYYITEDEYDLLQSQAIYTVGMENFNSPISYLDDSGNLAGIAVDTIDMIATAAGINYQIVEVADDASVDELNNFDFLILALSQEESSEYIESTPYYEIPLLLIDRLMEDDESISNIGILTYYGITEVALENHIYDREIYEYSNILEMQTAYNNGEIDSFIITTTALNSIRNNIEDLNFISNTVDSHYNLTILFPSDYSSEKIDIFNKLIMQLDETALNNSVLKHSTTIMVYSLGIKDFIEDYPILTASIFCSFILCFWLYNRKRKKDLSKIINIDDLTGLSTQHRFLNQAKTLIAQDENNTYSILTLDIDNFKYINEFYNYEIGTKVLKAVGDNIKMFGTDAKLIARAHADNFLLLVNTKGIHNKIDFAKKEDGNGLYEQLRNYVGPIYNITFSIGIYEVHDKHLDLNFMIDCANVAKALGKDIAHTTVYKYTSEMHTERIRNNDIVANMTFALEREEFILYYQPKLLLDTKKCIGAEALVRWIKDGTLVPPDHFIPLFERNGFIEELDYYILDSTCRFIQRNPSVPKISVNLSGVTIMEDDLVKRILAIVDTYQIPYTQIDIEITESAFVENFEQTRIKIQTLQSLGFTIAMDDFGAGISSLNRLKNIPIDSLKIDREFIIDSIENERGRHIIKNVLHMAKDLDLETIAEGIETPEQEAFLHQLKCDIGQGYYFSRPLTEKDFINFLQKRQI